MGMKVRSARGEMVDFDLLKVKQQIAATPAIDVTARENFVEKRLRRRPKRNPAPLPEIKPAVPDEELETEVEEAVVEDAQEVVEEPEKVEEPEIKPTRKVK